MHAASALVRRYARCCAAFPGRSGRRFRRRIL